MKKTLPVDETGLKNSILRIPMIKIYYLKTYRTLCATDFVLLHTRLLWFVSTEMRGTYTSSGSTPLPE